MRSKNDRPKEWEHTSCWLVRHCGHPTAHTPYYGVTPDGRVLLTGGFDVGAAFQYLEDAQKEVERRARSEGWEEPPTGPLFEPR